MALTNEQWRLARQVFSDAFRSSFSYAIATVNEDGSPHVAPVASLMLRDDRTGFFFDGYLGTSARNLRRNDRVCILATDNNKWLLLKSMLLGRFVGLPAVRLMGTVGERREASAEEHRLFQKRFRRYRFLKGYDLLWGDLKYVRDITFDAALPVSIGAMSKGLWPE
jgi:predicted pyridoxine 5'-phosphate oxidase superfamily flavin-nucleotide-binding protein